MSKLPLVTIGIINYNCESFLKNCIVSYINQSYENIEIILIDDCSTDGSINILKGFEQKYENIRCIYHEKNSGGPSQGIRELIKEAKGKYFHWIASDDYADLDLIKNSVDYLKKTNLDYAYCNFNITNENNDVINKWNYFVPTLNEMIFKIFNTGSGIIPMNGVYRLDFFKDKNITWNVYKNNDHSSDTINSLYFIKNGMKYGLLNESLIFYRLHNNNCSHNIEERIKTSLTIYDFIIQNFSEELYFPQVEWNKYPDRDQLKSYIIASFYYIKIVGYIQGKDLPTHINYKITEEQLNSCITSFINEGIQYISEGLSQGNTYNKELIQLQDLYSSISQKGN